MINRLRRRTRRLFAIAGVLGVGLVLVTGASVALGSATLPKIWKYVGKSSGTSPAPVTFTVSAGDTKITSFVGTLAYNGKCGHGGA